MESKLKSAASESKSCEITRLAAESDVDENNEVVTLKRALHIASAIQDAICRDMEEVEGGKHSVKEDSFTHTTSERVIHGRTRTLSGTVIEKAGIGVTYVVGNMAPNAVNPANAAMESLWDKRQRAGLPLPFSVVGVSCIIHPTNPFAPTMHFNYRYFEVGEGDDSLKWFGGGADMTPHYLDEEDAVFFHAVHKEACDQLDPTYYPLFKKACDEYFYIKHRAERRGIGGVFFDNMFDKSAEHMLRLTETLGAAVNRAYFPVLKKQMNHPYDDSHLRWRDIRHGRYVEFNLIHDRGTKFGLETDGSRVESVLMSLPLTVRFEYNHSPAQGSAEDVLLQTLRNEPRDWLNINKAA